MADYSAICRYAAVGQEDEGSSSGGHSSGDLAAPRRTERVVKALVAFVIMCYCGAEARLLIKNDECCF